MMMVLPLGKFSKNHLIQLVNFTVFKLNPNKSGLVKVMIRRNLQSCRLTSYKLGWLKYWVGQKDHSSFSVPSYEKLKLLCQLYGNIYHYWNFQVALVVKNPPAKAGELVSIPGSGRSAGEGNGKPPEYSCPENPMDR